MWVFNPRFVVIILHMLLIEIGTGRMLNVIVIFNLSGVSVIIFPRLEMVHTLCACMNLMTGLKGYCCNEKC